MLLAEIPLPDPNSYSSIGWVMVIIAALAFGANQIWELVNRARGDDPHPPNSQLEADARDIKRRVKALEEWKDGLMQKLEDDKNDIIGAGERREKSLKNEISNLSQRMDGMQKSLGEIPGELFAMMANAKNVLGNGGGK